MRRFVIGGVLAALIIAAGGTAAQGQPVLPLPPRVADAPTGSEFYQQILPLNKSAREQAIINEVARGNVPPFWRTFLPITATANGRTVTYWVAPDYVAIGSDTDFFRMPMSAPLAQQVVEIMGCSLPTRKMVNDVYTAATVKLAPHPFSPDTYDIDSVEVFWLSQQAIETQRAGQPLGAIVGGTKKDVVVTAQLPLRPPPPRVTIYGWHQLNGQPIQPLSLVHGASYEDYSHGIRAVWNTVTITEGIGERTVPAVLADATLASLLSDEGAFTSSTYPVPNPYPLPGEEPPPNMLLNPGFEEEFIQGAGVHWNKWQAPASSAITFGRATVNRAEGVASQYFARIGGGALDGAVWQRVDVTPGREYRVAAQAKRQSTYDGTFLRVGIDVEGMTDPQGEKVIYTDLVGANDTWIPFETVVRAKGNGITLFLRGGHTSAATGSNPYFYFDATSISAEPLQGLSAWVIE